MRMSCLECVRKHIGEAEISMEEAFMGYPHHAVWAVGSFSHAASESIKAFPELAARIRAARIAFEACLARVLTGTPIQELANDMPDMEGLAIELHDLILQELLSGTTADGVRSVRDALDIPQKRDKHKRRTEITDELRNQPG